MNSEYLIRENFTILNNLSEEFNSNNIVDFFFSVQKIYNNTKLLINGGSNQGVFNGGSNQGVFNGGSNQGVFNGGSDQGVFNGGSDQGVFNGGSNGVFNGGSNQGVFNRGSDQGVFNGGDSDQEWGSEQGDSNGDSDQEWGSEQGDSIGGESIFSFVIFIVFSILKKMYSKDNALKTVKYTSAFSSSSCSICFESFSLGQEIYCTSCKHIFCCPCLNKWLDEKDNCPMCRQLVNK
jgi:hypothetical protein